MGTGPLFLSWQCTDGMRQPAYEIEVTANNKTVWQSGKVQSSAILLMIGGLLCCFISAPGLQHGTFPTGCSSLLPPFAG